MGQIYNRMSAGLLVTFLTAWSVAKFEALRGIFFNLDTMSPNALGYLAMFAPLAMLIWFMFRGQNLSADSVRKFFYAFSALLGVSMSSVFMIFSGGSIAQIFLLTSSAFAGLSIWGYTTGKDLSGWGSFLLMGLIGLIGAMIINMFLGSEALGTTVSVIGVGIFAGFIAYDTQSIKTAYLSGLQHADAETRDKAISLSAMNLHLNFINMFQFLLDLLGSMSIFDGFDLFD
jgi:FtsH-binding integral membrane protein